MRPVIHLDSAGALPAERPPGLGVRLAAMARVPTWVAALTEGRPQYAFAVGDAEVALMDRALAARATPLFSGPEPVDAYFAALDARWSGLGAAGRFAPGAWGFQRHGTPDGLGARFDRLPIPPGSSVVCTCLARQGCHLRHLAPHLDRAGWDVRLYGAPLRSACPACMAPVIRAGLASAGAPCPACGDPLLGAPAPAGA